MTTRRILFVDDEPHILSGLKRTLRTHRSIWDMNFVDSGEAALKTIDDEPVDVVVSDMRMPGIDGATLLKKVQGKSPRTVRIILSGHSDLEASMRSACVSHQFLSKPCDADELKSVVDRACQLEELLRDPSLRSELGEVVELPVIPKVYRELVEALGEPEVDIARVGEIVGQDQAISAKILQLVNSSFFGIRREISNVEEATTYLGITTIRDLVLSAEVFKQFEGGVKVPGFSLEAEQEHSLLTSRIARSLLDDKRLADQAFISGMLHDVGKLVMSTQLPDKLSEIIAEGGGKTEPFCDVEQRCMGTGHAEIGAYLLGLWGMPYPVVEAVAHHHQPSRVAGQTEFGVLPAVHVAQALAREIATGNFDGKDLDQELLSELGVADRIPEWRDSAGEIAAG